MFELFNPNKTLLPIQSIEEQLSLAHVQAIAAQAGVSVSYFSIDYGIDGTFRSISNRGSRLVVDGFGLDFQLKASINCIIEPEHIVYDLDVKNYNDLIDRQFSNRRIPFILLLKVLPTDQSEWLTATEDCLTLNGGCYWTSLSGELSNNIKTVRIRISRRQFFSPTALQWMLSQIDNGVWS
jgi:Domain of unknown function (DUF4365)